MEKFRFSEIANLFIPLGLIIILFFTVIFVIILPYSKNYLIEIENDKIRQLVESELQIITSLDHDVKSGNLSIAEARKLAIELIRDQRHGEEKEFYFWIIDMKPTLIMHPFRSELENTYVGDYTDPAGNKLFQDMVDLVKRTDGGYVEYQWQVLDDPTNITDKKSYVKSYPEWGWIIGTGFYKEATFKDINRLFLLVTLVSILVMIIVILSSVILIQQRFKITKRNKFFAKSLLESEKRYEVLLDSMNEGFIMQDQSGIMLLVNSQLCEMVGYSRKEIIGKKTTILLPEEFRKLYRENMNKRIQGEDSPYELTLQSTDGRLIPVIVSPRGMFSEDGQFQGSYATFTNVSLLKKIEKKLSYSLEEKNILIKELHHRVKNNLQIIISLFNMQSVQIDKPVILSILKDFEARVYTMALVHEIIYETENFKFIELSKYINRLIGDNLSSYRSEISDIDLKIQIEEIKLTIDESLNCGLIINELFSNSLEHAFPAAKPDKEVNISADLADKILKLTFSDNGCGIPSEESEALGLNSKKIGLQLVYMLIDQMNGSVELEISEKGTKFKIELPLTHQQF